MAERSSGRILGETKIEKSFAILLGIRVIFLNSSDNLITFFVSFNKFIRFITLFHRGNIFSPSFTELTFGKSDLIIILELHPA